LLPQRLIFVFSASSDRAINVFHKARKSYIFIVQRVLTEIRTFQKLKNSVSYYRNLIINTPCGLCRSSDVLSTTGEKDIE